MEEDVEDRLNKIEEKLVEQDHRLFPSIIAYYKSEKKSKTRFAALKAILWQLISSRTISAAGISITAIVGVYLAYLSTQILTKQNDLINAQNIRVEQQTYLSESNRRAALVFELSNILDEIDEEIDAIEASLKEEGFNKFKDLEFSIRDEFKQNNTKEKYNEIKDYLDELNISIRIDGFIIYLKPIISKRLEGRIISISRSLRPYKYLEINGELITNPLSPERAQLLVSIITSDIYTSQFLPLGNFNYSDLEGVNLMGAEFNAAKLEYSNFENADLDVSRFGSASMDYSTFKGANLMHTNMDYCYANHVDFSEAWMNSASLEKAEFNNSVFFKTNLENATLMSSKLDSVNFCRAILPPSNNFRNSEFSILYLDGAFVQEEAFLDSLEVKCNTKMKLSNFYYQEAWNEKNDTLYISLESMYSTLQREKLYILRKKTLPNN